MLNLGNRRRWVASFTSRPLYPWGRNLRYALYRRLSGSQSRPACNLVTTLTELPWPGASFADLRFLELQWNVFKTIFPPNYFKDTHFNFKSKNSHRKSNVSGLKSARDNVRYRASYRRCERPCFLTPFSVRSVNPLTHWQM